MNSTPSVVLHLPAGPSTTITLPRGLPPPRIASSPTTPVLTGSDSAMSPPYETLVRRRARRRTSDWVDSASDASASDASLIASSRLLRPSGVEATSINDASHPVPEVWRTYIRAAGVGFWERFRKPASVSKSSDLAV